MQLRLIQQPSLQLRAQRQPAKARAPAELPLWHSQQLHPAGAGEEVRQETGLVLVVVLQSSQPVRRQLELGNPVHRLWLMSMSSQLPASAGAWLRLLLPRLL